uniref:Uncharacterized protein n=1 Tax=Oryza sativa subsp. japonica TaxID=39947 RepID=Q10J63_ORYSJ|nr:hypothetical protein LOC_Os03g31800 [Oryza sativa Japonica Group]
MERYQRSPYYSNTVVEISNVDSGAPEVDHLHVLIAEDNPDQLRDISNIYLHRRQFSQVTRMSSIYYSGFHTSGQDSTTTDSQNLGKKLDCLGELLATEILGEAAAARSSPNRPFYQ